MHAANTAVQYPPFDVSHVSLTPSSTLCPSFELSLVNNDGSPLNHEIFSFTGNALTIDTQNTDYSGIYKIKMIAQHSHTYSQTGELTFIVVLVYYCETSTVSNPG